MPTQKIAITLEKDLLKEIDRGVKNGQFKNRSRAIEEAVKEKIERQRIRKNVPHPSALPGATGAEEEETPGRRVEKSS